MTTGRINQVTFVRGGLRGQVSENSAGLRFVMHKTLRLTASLDPMSQTLLALTELLLTDTTHPRRLPF